MRIKAERFFPKWQQYCYIQSHMTEFLTDPLWCIHWKDSKEQVLGTGGFVTKESAEAYVKEHLQVFIDKKFEETFLK